jgi:hypothetical protein
MSIICINLMIQIFQKALEIWSRIPSPHRPEPQSSAVTVWETLHVSYSAPSSLVELDRRCRGAQATASIMMALCSVGKRLIHSRRLPQ